MKILIWQSWGGVSVYSASEENWPTISESLVDLLKGRGYDDDAINAASRACTYEALADVVNDFCDGDEAFDKFVVCELQ